MVYSDGVRSVEVKKMDGFWVVSKLDGAEMFMHQNKSQVTKFLKEMSFSKV